MPFGVFLSIFMTLSLLNTPATGSVFSRSFRISDAVGTVQRVEKAGVDLIATTNRALKAPKTANLVPDLG
jgi:hypothetical protein